MNKEVERSKTIKLPGCFLMNNNRFSVITKFILLLVFSDLLSAEQNEGNENSSIAFGAKLISNYAKSAQALPE